MLNFVLPDANNTTLEVFRSIAICSPSQNLFDDLVDSSEDADLLSLFEAKSSEIERSQRKSNRVFQYGNIDNSLGCFDRHFWSFSRFGGRDYGVWYGALEERTAKLETLHHRPEICDSDLEKALGPIIQDRRMFGAHLSSHSSIDLRNEVSRYPELLDKHDYSLCQKLGVWARENKVQSFQSFSVRNVAGTCVPVFDSSIVTDKILYDYHNFFPIDGASPYSSCE